MRNNFFFIGMLLMAFSCQKQMPGATNIAETNMPDENIFSSENGKIQTTVINNIRFEAQYRPVEEIIATESKNKTLTQEEYSARKKELEGMQYYLLRIKADNTSQDVLTYNMTDQSEYFTRDNYYAFGFKEDIQLVENDTLACGLYHYINTHGLSPHIEVLMAFKETHSKEDRTLVIFDQVYKTGIIKFRFPAYLFKKES